MVDLQFVGLAILSGALGVKRLRGVVGVGSGAHFG